MSKTETFSLPLNMIGGEQKTITIPFDSFNVTNDKAFNKQLEDDNREEKFLYAYTDSGISENNRNWKPEIMVSIAEQVVDKLPVGYLGHIKPTDYGFEFPDPQIVWFGSCTEEMTDKTTRLWLKGYLLPTANKLETWIKTKAVDSISVYGKISYNMKGEVLDIVSVDLKSIDISRKLGEGLNSQIVGLYGEMDVAYEDVREKLQISLRSYFKENCYDLGLCKKKYVMHTKELENPYIYCYVKKMYIDDKTAIANVEASGNHNRYFEVKYEVDENDASVKIGKITEVVENITYVKKKNGITEENIGDAGEMSNNNVKEELNMPMDWSKVTMDDVKSAPFYNDLKTSIAQEMATESQQKVLLAKAGEMDAIVGIVGEQADMVSTIKSIAQFNAKFVGEMSAIFGGEQELTPDEIVEKATEAKETVDAVKEAVGAEDNDEAVEKVKELAESESVQLAQTAIDEVNDTFEELIKGVTNETVAEYVREDFEDIIGVDPKDIEDVDSWKKTSIKDINDTFEAVVSKHTKRIEKTFKNGKAVGEMNAFEDLGNNLGTANKQDKDEDPDIAEAKRLGYGQ